MSMDYGSGQVDPEIADLMGIPAAQPAEKPEFSELFAGEVTVEQQDAESVDVTRKSFEVQTAFEENSKPFFSDKNYYRTLLGDEGESGKRVHQQLTQFAAAQDPKDKSVYRARLMTAYWELSQRIAANISPQLKAPKKLLLRFGILSPTLISQEQRELISRMIWDNNTGEPVHYQDEWLLKVAQGAVSPSATDEVKRAKIDAGQKTREIVEKRRGQRQAELALLQNKIDQLETLESQLSECTKVVHRHQTRADFGGLKDVFTPEQREAITQINTLLRQLSNLDREIKSSYTVLENMDRELKELVERAEADGVDTSVDRSVVINEFQSLRQMSKMCVGRQGNHLPILMKQYFRPSLRDIATRENAINIMARVESLDPGLFERTFKGQTNRIVPHVLLLPNYGESGICWEPFERFNKASSRGRIASAQARSASAVIPASIAGPLTDHSPAAARIRSPSAGAQSAKPSRSPAKP